jgi:hypothetical protein
MSGCHTVFCAFIVSQAMELEKRLTQGQPFAAADLASSRMSSFEWHFAFPRSRGSTKYVVSLVGRPELFCLPAE